MGLPDMPECFRSNIITLHQASFDSDGKAYMTESTLPCFDFDGIKEWYIKEKIPNVKPSPASNDALLIGENGMVFIEFKNGKIDNAENNRIIQKIYDSLLILFDRAVDMGWFREDFQADISYTRNHMEYVLVYNEEKYASRFPTAQTKKGMERQKLQASVCRDKINKYVRRRGNRALVKFGLDRFRGYVFKEVYTLTESEFNAEFIPTLKDGVL